MAGDPARRRGKALRRGARLFGSALIGVGVLALIWAALVWRWGDPLTGLYTRYEQHQLRHDYQQQVTRYARIRPQRLAKHAESGSGRLPVGQMLLALSRAATAYRNRLEQGEPVGVLVVPRMGLSVVVVEGTDRTSLRRGPGRDRRTFVPGQHQLVYVAGHRTTFGAPFAHIDQLQSGDRIDFDLPYAKFSYVVTGHRIVAANDMDVLQSAGKEQLSLQACHPLFFATQRYIADARLARVAVPDGRGGWNPYRF